MSRPPALERAEPSSAATPMTDDGLPPLREVIRRYELNAKKSLGQNFILDLNLTRRIARLSGSLAGVTAVEVGPGPGGLTRALLMEGARRVVAIERDPRCLSALAEIARVYPDRLVVVEGDAREFDWTHHVGASHGDGEIAIVANLPYAVATQLLTGWLETEPWPPWWSRMTLMFQKEVAQRIVAVPGTKAYGRLAVLAQWRATPHLALTLSPAAFTPPPKVDSAVVTFLPRPQPLPAGSATVLAKVTAAAFGQRRKMLRQSLKALTPMPELLIREAGLDPEMRAEQVDVAGFARLAALWAGRSA